MGVIIGALYQLKKLFEIKPEDQRYLSMVGIRMDKPENGFLTNSSRKPDPGHQAINEILGRPGKPKYRSLFE